MAGERRKRQQRVRHEAGGSTGPAPDPQPCPDTGHETQAAPTTNTATAAAAVMAKPAQQGGAGSGGGTGGSGGSRGGGSGRGRGRRGGGVAVATVDEKQYYQPVTIMESKGSAPTDELDEQPRQYRRRGIVSNWSRYEERNPALDELEDGRDYLIGEDFSAVLQQQSQGSLGGGHLRLRGEETWGFGGEGGGLTLCSGGQQHGLGALRVTDLANTIATIPFMEQLGMDDNRLPKQLSEYYSQLAEDNRRLYNPCEDPASVADTAELLEEQLQRLRLTFFDSAAPRVSSDDGTRSPQEVKDGAKEAGKIHKKEPPASRTTEAGNYHSHIDDFDDSFASSVDFNSLDTALDDEISQESEVKVDLTEKMCRAFGSDINDVGDDFGGFDINVDGNETEEASGASQGSLQQPQLKDYHDNSGVQDDNLPVSSKSKNRSKAKKSNDNENVFTAAAPASTAAPHAGDDSAQELDFSSGNLAFSFDLPKVDSASVKGPFSVADKASKNKEDIDIFTPVEDQSKKPNKLVKDQPVIDLDAPIVPVPVSLVNTKEDTKELEDWLDSVLDD